MGGLYSAYFGQSGVMGLMSNGVKVSINAAGPSYFTGGSVGIGTSAPAKKLDVSGDLQVSTQGYFGNTLTLNDGSSLALPQAGGKGTYGAPSDQYPVRLYQEKGWNFTLPNTTDNAFRVRGKNVAGSVTQTNEKVLFNVDGVTGNATALGKVAGSQLCIGTDCKSSWAATSNYLPITYPSTTGPLYDAYGIQPFTSIAGAVFNAPITVFPQRVQDDTTKFQTNKFYGDIEVKPYEMDVQTSVGVKRAISKGTISAEGDVCAGVAGSATNPQVCLKGGAGGAGVIELITVRTAQSFGLIDGIYWPYGGRYMGESLVCPTGKVMVGYLPQVQYQNNGGILCR
jgi:hypothetical protein